MMKLFRINLYKLKDIAMSRNEVYAEMKETLGQVPGFFEEIPDDALVLEWGLFKKYVLSNNTEIDPKYRELIGAAAAAASHCWYCSNFHIGVAKLHGATDAEIQETMAIAKMGRGWSAYLNGMVYDRERFMKELNEIGAYLNKKAEIAH